MLPIICKNFTGNSYEMQIGILVSTKVQKTVLIGLYIFGYPFKNAIPHIPKNPCFMKEFDQCLGIDVS